MENETPQAKAPKSLWVAYWAWGAISIGCAAFQCATYAREDIFLIAVTVLSMLFYLPAYSIYRAVLPAIGGGSCVLLVFLMLVQLWLLSRLFVWFGTRND